MPEFGLPEEVALAVGEELRFRLPGLGTAGYRWDVQVQGPEGVVAISRAPADRPIGADGRPESGSIDVEVTIRGEVAGEVTVKLAQRRPWEHDEPPRLDATVRVLVS